MLANPNTRKILYIVGVVSSAILTVLSTLNMLDPAAAGSLNSALTTVLGLMGVGATATATVAVSRQQKNGAFDPVNPVDQVVNGIQAAIQQANSAAIDLERVKAATAEALSTADVASVGPLVDQILNAVTKKS